MPLAIFAAVAYIPLLLTSPGTISADTKAYLLIDPGTLLQRAPWMWDSHVDAGTVTHQNIGYLFPLGPWYWIFRTLGVPTWIAERLWFGTLLFVAGAGTMWMLKRLGMRGAGPIVAGFVYMLSPYMLAYMGRTSVILTPWSALPLLVGLMFAALRERTWRAPVLFALIVTVMAGTNASSVIFVLIGPLVLIPYAIWVTRDVDLRQSLRALIRIAVVTGPAQLWWLSGLYVQGKYGLPILQLTETVETVAQTSTAAEGLRGLGYWYFYGKDGLTSWTESGPLYTQTLVMLVISFVLPALGLVGAILTRWRWRAYFVMLVLIGLVFAVGTYPYHDPSPIGSVIKFTTSLEVGFALRNSPRVLPLLVLGIAGLVACLVEALQPAIIRRFSGVRGRRLAMALPIAVIAIAVLNLPPLWTGGLVQADMAFPEKLPSYWTDAAAWLDAQGDGRVLELPGADFGAYRWGQTQDPLTPGLIERDWIGRELTAYGAPATVDLLRALDAQFQEGVGDPAAVADIARLFSASDVLLRLDSQYERYHGPRPADLWAQFGAGDAANGLGAPVTFGDPTTATADPRQPTIDEAELARRGSSVTPPLAVLPVDGVRPKVRAESTRHPTIVWGDGQGMVQASSSGLLASDRPLFYAATVNADAHLPTLLAESRPSLIVTDTNRRRAQRWGTTRENNGATETADSTPLVDDPKDTRIEVFPGQTSADQSVAWFGDQVTDVQATSYGNIVAYSAEVRPANAIDGDPRTAWTTGGYSDVIGDRIEITYTVPITADHVDLLQTQGNRFITKATVLLDGAPVTTVDMTDASFVGTGQRVELGGPHTFGRLSVRIDAANVSGLQNYVGISNVGFREITVPGVAAQEWIVTPSRGLGDYGDAPVTYLFSRWRSNPVEGYRQDPELRMLRIFEVPERTSLPMVGSARLSTDTDGAVIDATLGRPGLVDGFPIVAGTTYLDGVPADRPSSSLDGDPSTAWVTPFGSQVGSAITIQSPTPLTFDTMHLQIVADGRHSVPTKLELTTDDGVVHLVDVPTIADSPGTETPVAVDVATGSLSTRTLGVKIAAEREVTTTEYFSGNQHAFPIAIAEFGLPRTVAALPAMLPTECRTGLVSIDGSDVPVTVTGSTADAIALGALQVRTCDPMVFLEKGSHRLATAAGIGLGLDIDSIQVGPDAVMTSTRDVAPADETPNIAVDRTGELSYRVDVNDASSPFWLVLGQSLSDGWTAKVKGGDSLGTPTLIDGFANGWYVDPAKAGTSFTIEITWKPQSIVWIAIYLSGAWLALLAAAAIWLSWRHRGTKSVDDCANPSLTGFERDPDVVPTMTRLWTVGGLAILGALIGGTGVAIAIAAVAAIALWSRRRTITTALASMGSIAGIVMLYVGLQYRRHYPTGVEWPSGFWIAHQLGLIAVLVVVSESLTRFLVRRYTNNEQKASDANQMNEGSALTR